MVPYLRVVLGEDGAVWIVEWRGFGGELESVSPTISEQVLAPLAASEAYTAALVDLAAHASAGGKLRLLAGFGGAGPMSLQALRHERLRGEVASAEFVADNVSVVVVSPTAWQSPLHRSIGDSLPAHFARRQRWGAVALSLACRVGLEGRLARWAVPTVEVGSDSRLVTAWSLGFLEPVANHVDLTRELLLATRAVDQEAGLRIFKASCEARAMREAAADDADDEEFAVGSAARSAQTTSRPKEKGVFGINDRLGNEFYSSSPFLPAARAAVPVTLLLPEDACGADAIIIQALRGAVTEAQRIMLQTASAATTGAEEVARAHMENTLVQRILELDEHFHKSSRIRRSNVGSDGSSDSGKGVDDGGVIHKSSARSVAECRRLVDEVLPMRVEDVFGSDDCLVEDTEVIADHFLQAIELSSRGRKP
eukprot:TRINITY_DN39964_c0_g1_i1.p1 TRINITY_DN39964_c0_g1~~TRINITY_DN39964_c0_g1_i1.p1  ORF type:complete len:424 (+),score=86.11 TRINITY_DN39964_c0_g1_i1:78-1349(+)